MSDFCLPFAVANPRGSGVARGGGGAEMTRHTPFLSWSPIFDPNCQRQDAKLGALPEFFFRDRFERS